MSKKYEKVRLFFSFVLDIEKDISIRLQLITHAGIKPRWRKEATRMIIAI